MRGVQVLRHGVVRDVQDPSQELVHGVQDLSQGAVCGVRDLHQGSAQLLHDKVARVEQDEPHFLLSETLLIEVHMIVKSSPRDLTLSEKLK